MNDDKKKERKIVHSSEIKENYLYVILTLQNESTKKFKYIYILHDK